jgi:hypothetical protein
MDTEGSLPHSQQPATRPWEYECGPEIARNIQPKVFIFMDLITANIYL